MTVYKIYWLTFILLISSQLFAEYESASSDDDRLSYQIQPDPIRYPLGTSTSIHTATSTSLNTATATNTMTHTNTKTNTSTRTGR